MTMAADPRVVAGIEHASFTDAEALPQLGITAPLGAIDPATALGTQHTDEPAFFDRRLCGQAGHLLDGASPSCPAMAFVGR